jgi:hypothetical protein
MGIDFSHGDAHWSYSSFNNFRRKLAKEINMDLDQMQGFGGDIPFSNYVDNIIPLLDHSDCDGKLTIGQCKKVEPRLRELVSKWVNDDWDKERALELADGMKSAYENHEQFIFM